MANTWEPFSGNSLYHLNRPVQASVENAITVKDDYMLLNEF